MFEKRRKVADKWIVDGTNNKTPTTEQNLPSASVSILKKSYENTETTKVTEMVSSMKVPPAPLPPQTPIVNTQLETKTENGDLKYRSSFKPLSSPRIKSSLPLENDNQQPFKMEKSLTNDQIVSN